LEIKKKIFGEKEEVKHTAQRPKSPDRMREKLPNFNL
jgi:hypothetical protein